MIFRFLGKMPRGRFEYTCECGNYEITRISEDKSAANFDCKKCGLLINLWEQNYHWHMSITK